MNQPDLSFGFWGSLARAVGGGRDFGPVDFGQLRRRKSPNDALICPTGTCALAKADATAPIWPKPAAHVLEALKHIALTEPRTRLLRDSDSPLRMRFVQYSERLGFPDIVDAKAFDLGEQGSTVALYSRSVFGHGDHGINLARVMRWTAELQKTLDK